jgi:hypothetical protein
MFCPLATLVLLTTAPQQDTDTIRYLHNLTIPPGGKIGEVICIGCSVRIAGEATDDVTAIGGDIEVTGSVRGDVTAMGGRIRVARTAAPAATHSRLGGRDRGRFRRPHCRRTGWESAGPDTGTVRLAREERARVPVR